MSWATIDQAVDALAAGNFVLVVDDEHRENEGDLILAAEMATPERIAFMVRHTSGLICVPLSGDRLDELAVPLMVLENTDSHETAFTVSVDAVAGTTTGISAADRSATIRALVDPKTRPADLARPGHIFPLRYREPGVLVRPGHTEASVDLARLAGLYPGGVLSEVVNDDGTMARGESLEQFAETHHIPIVSIDQLVTHRWKTESLVQRTTSTRISTPYGDFTALVYRAAHDGSQHIVLIRGEVAGQKGILTRIHTECLPGDVFGNGDCRCSEYLATALQAIDREGLGVMVYTRGHVGGSVGAFDRLGVERLHEDAGVDHRYTARHYGVDAQILGDLKVESVRVMANSESSISQLEELGVIVTQHIPIRAEADRAR